MLRFSGRVAIVTGASRGIGRATAEAFGREGARVLVNYRTREGEAREVVDRLNGPRPGTAVAFRADVGDADAVRAMVAACVESFGGIDFLVNNAGYAHPATILELTDADWRETMRTNIDGVFYCVREAVPHMLKRGGGAIVNISSIAALDGGTRSPAYSASKGAVNTFSKIVANQLGPHGIRVNVVAPGLTDTGMQRSLGDERIEAMTKSIPLGRMADPGEVAAVILFLCSDESSYVTGQCIPVTGGK